MKKTANEIVEFNIEENLEKTFLNNIYILNPSVSVLTLSTIILIYFIEYIYHETIYISLPDDWRLLIIGISHAILAWLYIFYKPLKKFSYKVHIIIGLYTIYFFVRSLNVYWAIFFAIKDVIFK